MVLFRVFSIFRWWGWTLLTIAFYRYILVVRVRVDGIFEPESTDHRRDHIRLSHEIRHIAQHGGKFTRINIELNHDPVRHKYNRFCVEIKTWYLSIILQGVWELGQIRTRYRNAWRRTSSSNTVGICQYVSPGRVLVIIVDLYRNVNICNEEHSQIHNMAIGQMMTLRMRTKRHFIALEMKKFYAIITNYCPAQ